MSKWYDTVGRMGRRRGLGLGATGEVKIAGGDEGGEQLVRDKQACRI